MRFSIKMLKQFEAYKAAVKELELGLCSVAEFLLVHQAWNAAVDKWQEENCSTSNYGNF